MMKYPREFYDIEVVGAYVGPTMTVEGFGLITYGYPVTPETRHHFPSEYVVNHGHVWKIER